MNTTPDSDVSGKTRARLVPGGSAGAGSPPARSVAPARGGRDRAGAIGLAATPVAARGCGDFRFNPPERIATRIGRVGGPHPHGARLRGGGQHPIPLRDLCRSGSCKRLLFSCRRLWHRKSCDSYCNSRRDRASSRPTCRPGPPTRRASSERAGSIRQKRRYRCRSGTRARFRFGVPSRLAQSGSPAQPAGRRPQMARAGCSGAAGRGSTSRSSPRAGIRTAGAPR